MRLVEVRLRGYRAYLNEVSIPIDRLTVLVGRNDAGKSSILDALDVFFNEAELEKEDCNVTAVPPEVQISCIFDDLPETLILDDSHPTSLRQENLLSADGRLEIRKTYSCSASKSKLIDICAFALFPSTDALRDLLTLKIADLKKTARAQGVDLAGVNETIKADLRAAIIRGTADPRLREQEVSLMKEAGKEIWNQLKLHMPVYALFKSDRASTDQDSEAQDPMKLAIKEAIQGRERELASVISDIQAELERVAERTVEKIREMNPDLARGLKPTIGNKNWDSLFKVSLTGDDDIPINKRGSGTRRLVLLNFFRAKAEDSQERASTGLIYAVEEPETSQHPDHQILLLEALESMAEEGRCQVMLTTHTPTLARRVDRRCLRLITRTAGQPSVELGSQDGTLQSIKKTLGVLRDHDVKAFVGVEGKYDIQFLRRISRILSAFEHDIADLYAEERAGRLVFVSLGGSNMDMWLNTLQELGIPEYYLTDRDHEPPAEPKYQEQIAQWNARGCRAWATSKRELENYLAPKAIRAVAPTYSGAGLPFEDVPALLAEATHSASEAEVAWADLPAEKRARKISNAKKTLNFRCVDAMTPDLLTAIDSADDVRSWLREISRTLRAGI